MVLPEYFCGVLADTRPHHLELLHDFHGLAHIQGQRLEALINEYFALLRDLVLGDGIEICEALMKKRSDVLQFLEHLRIIILLNKLNQLLIDLFDIRYLLLICIDYLLLIHQPLLLPLVLPLKLSNNVLFLLFDFPL